MKRIFVASSLETVAALTENGIVIILTQETKKTYGIDLPKPDKVTGGDKSTITWSLPNGLKITHTIRDPHVTFISTKGGSEVVLVDQPVATNPAAFRRGIDNALQTCHAKNVGPNILPEAVRPDVPAPAPSMRRIQVSPGGKKREVTVDELKTSATRLYESVLRQPEGKTVWMKRPPYVDPTGTCILFDIRRWGDWTADTVNLTEKSIHALKGYLGHFNKQIAMQVTYEIKEKQWIQFKVSATRT